MAASEGNHDTILIVGFVCYDLIFTAPYYPEEDSLVRANEFHKRRGGNASNSSTVVSQLGGKIELLATLTTDDYAQFFRDDLSERGIMFHNCRVYSEWTTPFTSIIQSLATETRTIVLHRAENYPEILLDDFHRLNLSSYKWIHFEGRNISNVLKMIDYLEAYNADKNNKAIMYSVELEKCTDKTKEIIPKADCIFVAKEFAKYLGYDTPTSTLKGLAAMVKPGAIIIAPWGEKGAWARCSNGDIVESKAHPPESIVDTTGAGDTFIGSTVFALSNKMPLPQAIDFGNKIAGAKCGMMGYDKINEVYQQILKDGN